MESSTFVWGIVNFCNKEILLWNVDLVLKFIYLLFFLNWLLFIFFKDIIYLFMRHREGERGRNTGRGRSRLHAGSPTWDSILGLRDQALGWRRHQTAESPGCPYLLIICARTYRFYFGGIQRKFKQKPKFTSIKENLSQFQPQSRITHWLLYAIPGVHRGDTIQTAVNFRYHE